MEKNFIFSFHFMMKLLKKVALKKKVMLVILGKILSSLLEETNTSALLMWKTRSFCLYQKKKKMMCNQASQCCHLSKGQQKFFSDHILLDKYIFPHLEYVRGFCSF